MAGPILVTGNLVALNDAIQIRAGTAVSIQLTGTWTGTVNFEASIDGVNFTAVAATPAVGGATASSATANGAWTLPNAGFAFIRLRFNPNTSGTVVASLYSVN